MPRRVLITFVLAMGLWSLAHIGREVVAAGGLAGQLGEALTKSGAERIADELERVHPGGAALFVRLATELPEDALLFGVYPTAGDADQERRVEALLLFGELQLLLFPRDVRPMPEGLGGPREPGAPAFVPPPAFAELAAAGKLFVLDLGYPYPERIEGFMAPMWALPRGVLWRPR